MVKFKVIEQISWANRLRFTIVFALKPEPRRDFWTFSRHQALKY